MATALGHSILRRSTDFLYPSCLSGKTLKALILKLDEVYSITTKGDYTLTVQPVLYKRRNADATTLDRVDLPAVTTKVHFDPRER